MRRLESHLDTVLKCDGRTDEQTHIVVHSVSRSRLRVSKPGSMQLSRRSTQRVYHLWDEWRTMLRWSL